MDSTWQNAKEVEIPNEALKQTLENEQSLQDRMYGFAKRSPFLIAGMLGFAIVGGIGAYKWKTRKIIPSLFLVQLRVAAQGTVIGCLTMGMIYQMYLQHSKPKPDDK
ncbi:HIG1 domain family member 1A, mitochondrial-like [Colletes gigas]|uniref:HIG1 domain family member 1A, mitochondrial-like n=1 Tax=Colletes gigas TaxID=935657 RepID=UPI001C9BBAA8|nr:HIG1 domain family member 1A, mitochondrial-like [Colletes gigas]